jgi:hypothetical protein
VATARCFVGVRSRSPQARAAHKCHERAREQQESNEKNTSANMALVDVEGFGWYAGATHEQDAIHYQRDARDTNGHYAAPRHPLPFALLVARFHLASPVV